MHFFDVHPNTHNSGSLSPRSFDYSKFLFFLFCCWSIHVSSRVQWPDGVPLHVENVFVASTYIFTFFQKGNRNFFEPNFRFLSFGSRFSRRVKKAFWRLGRPNILIRPEWLCCFVPEMSSFFSLVLCEKSTEWLGEEKEMIRRNLAKLLRCSLAPGGKAFLGLCRHKGRAFSKPTMPRIFLIH